MLSVVAGRFGVSVYLSTEILQAIAPGTDVIIVAKASKVGSTLGFATMEMYDTGGSLLARGDHIKHLPMGSMWDLMAKLVLSPFVLPIILKYGNTINSFKVHQLAFFCRSCFLRICYAMFRCCSCVATGTDDNLKWNCGSKVDDEKESETLSTQLHSKLALLTVI